MTCCLSFWNIFTVFGQLIGLACIQGSLATHYVQYVVTDFLHCHVYVNISSLSEYNWTSIERSKELRSCLKKNGWKYWVLHVIRLEIFSSIKRRTRRNLADLIFFFLSINGKPKFSCRTEPMPTFSSLRAWGMVTSYNSLSPYSSS